MFLFYAYRGIKAERDAFGSRRWGVGEGRVILNEGRKLRDLFLRTECFHRPDISVCGFDFFTLPH